MEEFLQYISDAFAALDAETLANIVVKNFSAFLGSILAGLIGVGLGTLIAYRKLRRDRQAIAAGRSDDIVNFSVELFEPDEQGVRRLQILALDEEVSIVKYIDNSAARKELLAAAKRTSKEDPLVRIGSVQALGAVNRSMVNHVGGHYGLWNGMAALGLPTLEKELLVAHTFERVDGAWQKLRVIGITRDQYEAIVADPEGWDSKIEPLPGREFQRDRLATMRIIALEYQRQLAAGTPGPVDRVAIRIPKAFF